MQAQGRYIKTLPLHESQEIILSDEDELRVKLKLRVTRDLIYGAFIVWSGYESLATLVPG